MKKRRPTHPKLYIDLKVKDGHNIFYFLSNVFNDHSSREIQKESINLICDNKNVCLFEKNKEQYDILKKYLVIQKKVLEKRKKDGNYEAYKIIKSSIKAMNDFENEFIIWFEKNKLS